MALIIGGESVQGHLKDWSLPKLKLGDGECNDDGGQHGGGGVMQGGRARCGEILRWADRAFGMQ